MREILKKGTSMEKEHTFGKTDLFMRVLTIMTLSMARESISKGETLRYGRETGCRGTGKVLAD